MAEPVTRQALAEASHVVTRLGGKTIHRGVSLRVEQGEITALIGGSGTGKSVLLRVLCGLLVPVSGHAWLFGKDVAAAARSGEINQLRTRFGMLFQDGALFSNLTVEQNVAAPLLEHTRLPRATCFDLARLKLSMVGLPPDAGDKLPDELSGGMRKRAALARALALDPELLFLDEPTSGLDPVSARAFDQLLRTLCDNLGLTALLITHDLDTLLSIADTIIVLANGKVLGAGDLAFIRQLDDPWLQSYFASRGDIPAPPPRETR